MRINYWNVSELITLDYNNEIWNTWAHESRKLSHTATLRSFPTTSNLYIIQLENCHEISPYLEYDLRNQHNLECWLEHFLWHILAYPKQAKGNIVNFLGRVCGRHSETEHTFVNHVRWKDEKLSDGNRKWIGVCWKIHISRNALVLSDVPKLRERRQTKFLRIELQILRLFFSSSRFLPP